MKINKIFQLAAIAALGLSFAACSNEEDDIFSQSAAERLNASSAKYTERLTAQPNGWAMQLYPTTDDEAPYGAGYLLLLDFDADHKVKAAMNNQLSNNVYEEDTSFWEIVTDDGPVLSFDTYNNVIHAFSNPEDLPFTGTQQSPNNEQGTGMGGDYEFIVVDAPEDASYMMLKGKKRATYNLLTPIEVGVDYEDYLTDVNNFQAKMFPASYPVCNYVAFGDSLYRMEGADDRLPNIYPDGADAVTTQFFDPFLITKRGDQYYLRFRDAFNINGHQPQEFHYDTTRDQFVSTEDSTCYIYGNDALTFYTSALDGGQQSWKFTSASNMSDSFKAIFDQVNDGFTSLSDSRTRYSLSSVGLSVNSGVLTLRFEYSVTRNRRTSTADADYNFTYEKTSDGVRFAYTEDYNNVATNVKSMVPAIQTMIDLLQQEWTCNGGETNFDLRTIKLTSKSDANMWFVSALG